MSNNNNNKKGKWGKTEAYLEKIDSMVKVEESLTETIDPSSIKANFLRLIESKSDDYSKIDFTPKEMQKIRKRVSRLTTGASAAIPLICRGKRGCPFANRCPILEVFKERKRDDPAVEFPALEGKPCLIEEDLLLNWTRFYIQEYEVEETSFTDIMMVRELAETELLLYRINSNLSKPENADLTQWSAVALDKNGNAISKREINTLFEIKERLANRKSKLTKLLVGDRQEKYKREAALKLKDAGDPSTTAAQLKSKLSHLIREADKRVLQLKEVEGEIIETTDGSLPPVTPEEDILAPEDLINGNDEE